MALRSPGREFQGELDTCLLSRELVKVTEQ